MDGVVSVAQGRLRGVWRGDQWCFAGIPYASAPVGELRWRPPLPAEVWTGVRDASEFGPIAPQRVATAGVTSPADPGSSAGQSEDCLSLNVWTPELPDEPTRLPGQGRPVMVFIHGGGFTSGSGSQSLYNGGNLARHGAAVVVTFNYRLGALGFLGHRGLGDPDGFVGNWGIHDQLAALGWVRDNIAAFGGDPSNVTLFGESAGAFSVSALMGTPSSAGLFRRAVVQSGGVHVHTIEEAERSAERMAAILGIQSCDRQSLVPVPAAALVEATAEIGARRPDPGTIPLPFLPVIDGVFLPEHPLTAVANGAADHVDLMIGTNRDELTLFGIGDPEIMALDDEGMIRWVALALPGVPADQVVATYRAARRSRGEKVGATDLWVAVGSDLVFRWPSLQLAAAHSAREAKAYVYLFEFASPAFGGILGSCHGLELPFVFGAVHVPEVQVFTGSGPTVERLSSQMQEAWLSFAASGSPGHEGIGPWLPWHPVRRATMVFGEDAGLVEAPRNQELEVIERHRPLVAGRSPGHGARAGEREAEN